MLTWQQVALKAVGRYHKGGGLVNKNAAFAKTLANTNLSVHDAVKAEGRYYQLLRLAARTRQTVVDRF